MAGTSNPIALPALQPVGGAESPDRRRMNSHETDFPRMKCKRLIYSNEAHKLDTYWMAFVFLTAQRSKSFNTKVGACIVNSDTQQLIGVGHNTSYKGCTPMLHSSVADLTGFNSSACSAALNAFASCRGADLARCTFYTSMYPTHKDAQLIIESGITEVVYKHDKFADRPSTEAAKRILAECHVSVKEHMYGDTPPPDLNSHLDDDDYFMAIVKVTAQMWSEHPLDDSKIGACIVDSRKRLVGLGYNRMPHTSSEDHGHFPLTPRRLGKRQDSMDTLVPFICHAEQIAIMHRTVPELDNCTMYVTRFPCSDCATMLVQFGIREVVYSDNPYPEREEYCTSKLILNDAKVMHRPHILGDDITVLSKICNSTPAVPPTPAGVVTTGSLSSKQLFGHRTKPVPPRRTSKRLQEKTQQKSK